ncbi:MAG: UvrD-helicase domain-containing protein [Candidatus Spechtbacterales bacterium]
MVPKHHLFKDSIYIADVNRILSTRYKHIPLTMNLLSSLNKKQKRAVTAPSGPLLILAGPGSGKTKTLVHRVAYLISSGIHPQNILALTFTNKAAGEMKDRILGLLKINPGLSHSPPMPTGEQELRQAGPPAPTVGTFHAVCAQILRREAPARRSLGAGGPGLGISRNFAIYDDADQLSVIKKAIKELGIDPKQLSPQKARSAISGAKDRLINPQSYKAENGNNYPGKEISKIYELYEEKLNAQDALDFGDLIFKVVLLFENNPLVLKKYQKKYAYILVDEYQDTNTAQYSLLNLLARESKNLCVVGDDAQAIYSWRNADFTNILNFKKDWPSAKIIKLEQNYRSSKNIIKAASELIKNNSQGYPKKLWTDNKKGKPVYIRGLPDAHSEAEFILNKINALVSEKKYRLKDFVVLYRTNVQSRAIEEVLLRAGMPYKIVGGIKFYQRKEIKDMVAWIRLAINKKDDTSRERLRDLPLSALKTRMLVPVSTKNEAIQILSEEFALKVKENLNLRKLMEYIARKTNFEQMLKDGTEQGEERWQNVLELFSSADEYSNIAPKDAVLKFLEDITLMQEADRVDKNSDLVHIMTLHMAKGLEFPIVFIAGCEEGILPHANSMFSQKELEEERRLFYVGITRAKKEVWCLVAGTRIVWGAIAHNPPSSFLYEIPPKYKDVELYEPPEDETDYLTDDDDIISLG